jgi:CRISPR/Cas system CSM-associated protein Csm3 (group 7 of RAMP superfamily)
MNLRDGVVFSFDCKLESPFHTTQREYRNLLKCAPFIAGTSLRGAILKALIELNCKNNINKLKSLSSYHEIKKFHSNCSEDCPVRCFFDAQKSNAVFSCGTLKGDSRYDLFTRIALTKDSRSAAEGMIVNAECISSGVDFQFSISLFDDAIDTVDKLKDALDLASQNGIGRFKSIGFGRFDIRKSGEESVDDLVYRTVDETEPDNSRVEIRLKTPFVFNSSKEAFDTKNLGDMFSALFNKRYNDLCVDGMVELLSISSTEMRLIPEFINRYSYELGKKESRLSAWIGSRFWLEFDEMTEDIKIQLAVGSSFGIGAWCNCGFGKFSTGCWNE